MARESLTHFLHHLRQAVGPAGERPPTDRQLLECFARAADQAAFAVLVGRHGALVLEVGRRLLGREQEAEDVFQATFLVLARKAGRVRWQESVAGWLYEVARRLARKARGRAARDAVRARRWAPVPRPPQAADDADWRGLLLEEVARLPDHYRTPVVLCFLEGRTHAAAAAQLGWPLGTVKGRLARARERLRARLIRRGVCPAVAAGLAVAPAEAAIPAALVAATLRAVGGADPGGAGRALADQWLRAEAVGRGRTVLLALTLALGLAAATYPAAPAPPAGGTPAPSQGRGEPVADGVIRRLGAARWRHGAPVRALAFAPDGQALATASLDHTAVVWDAADGRQRLVIPAGQGPLQAVAFAPDGRALATAGDRDGTVKLWDAASGAALRRLTGGGTGHQRLAFAADGRTLAAVGSDWAIYLWDLPTGQVRQRLAGHRPGPGGAVCSLALSADGRYAASLAVDPWAGMGHPPNPGDATVRLWDTATGQELQRWPNAPNGYGAVAFTPDGRTLLAPDRGGQLCWIDLATRQVRRTAAGAGSLGAIVAGPDGTVLTAAADFRGREPQLAVREATAGRAVGTVPAAGLHPGGLALAPDGGTLAAVDGNRVRVWDTATGQPRGEETGHTRPVRHVAVSADGRLIASGGADPAVLLWDAVTGAPRGRLELTGAECRGLAFVADGRLIAGDSGAITVWAPESGQALQRYAAGALIHSLAIAPDGRRAAWGGVKWHAAVLDLATGRPVAPRFPPPGEAVQALAFTPDGRRLAAVGRNPDPDTLVLMDAATLTVQRQFPLCQTEVMALAFTPDGRRLVTGGAEPALQVWDVETGQLLRQLRTAQARVAACAVSPDGRWLVAASHDPTLASPAAESTLQWWDAVTGTAGRTARGHAGWITALAFAPDGRTLVTGGTDAAVLVREARGN